MTAGLPMQITSAFMSEAGPGKIGFVFFIMRGDEFYALCRQTIPVQYSYAALPFTETCEYIDEPDDVMLF